MSFWEPSNICWLQFLVWKTSEPLLNLCQGWYINVCVGRWSSLPSHPLQVRYIIHTPVTFSFITIIPLLLHHAITSEWNARAFHGIGLWNALVPLTQVKRALDSAVIMKIFCLFLVVLLCVSFIEAGRKKSRGGGKNGGDNGNKNLGNSISTSKREDSISVFGQTNQCRAFNSINGIVQPTGLLGDCMFYVLKTMYHVWKPLSTNVWYPLQHPDIWTPPSTMMGLLDKESQSSIKQRLLSSAGNQAPKRFVT